MQQTAHSTVVRKFSIKQLIETLHTDSAKRVRCHLAEQLKMTYHHFVRITNELEGGDRTLRSDQLMFLADYFGVSVDDILTPYEDVSYRI